MNQTQVDTMVTSILNVLAGPIAKGLAAIALVIAGYMFFFGQASKGLIASIIIGCFIVFGAGWIVDIDRQSVVVGKSVLVRVDLGGGRILNKKKHKKATEP